MPSGRGEVQGGELPTPRPGAMAAAETTVTDANATLRHVELFPFLVSGIGVGVRHHDIWVCQRRGGHTRHPPHTPSQRSALLGGGSGLLSIQKVIRIGLSWAFLSAQCG